MNTTFVRSATIRMWQLWAIAALLAFGAWSWLLRDVLKECYRPAETSVQSQQASQDAKATQSGWWTRSSKRVVSLLIEDQSGASAICMAMLLLALARFGYLQWRLNLYQQLVNDKTRSAGAQARLGAHDPLVRFLSTGRKSDDFEWLERKLASTYDLHSFVGPCITLGLFGTLVGLWIGFVRTLGPAAALTGEGASLQAALSGSVVVVATAALSSITGIGLGQLVIEPLANYVDRNVETLVTGLMENDLSKKHS